MVNAASQPSPADAARLREAIHALGDYTHVTVRSRRGHLIVYADDDEPVARLTPLGAGQYGLSFHSHTGRWEPMPIAATLELVAQDLVATLGAFLHKTDFSPGKSGTDH